MVGLMIPPCGMSLRRVRQEHAGCSKQKLEHTQLRDFVSHANDRITGGWSRRDPGRKGGAGAWPARGVTGPGVRCI
jgi:hypothetical protein